MIMTCTAPSCGNATNGGTVCPSCLGRLRSDLVDVAELVDDVEDTVARLVNTGPPRVGSQPTETGLPFNVGAAEVRDIVHNVPSTWVRELWETHGLHRPAPMAAGRVGRLASHRRRAGTAPPRRHLA
jgi:hypothetical protein